MGDGYGPLLVARRGEDTTGRSALGLPFPESSPVHIWRSASSPDTPSTRWSCPSTRSLPRCVRGVQDLGLLIHEGQITYEDEGLSRVVDLGAWWKETTGLPLPLGANVVRRDLGR